LESRCARNLGNATDIENDEDGKEIHKKVHFAFNVELHGNNNTPSDYTDTMCGTESEKWGPSMAAEIFNFVKWKSWKPVQHSEASTLGQTIIKTKWVYKKKDQQDGSIRLKGHCISKGFEQRPGIDYTESFAPVTSIRAAIALALWMKVWSIEVINIEVAFLEGTLEEPHQMAPKGMGELGCMTEGQVWTTVAQLLKSMYGNANVALRFFKEYVEHMVLKEMGIHQNLADPCMFLKKHKGDLLVLLALLHVYDTQLCGEKQWNKLFKWNIKNHFNYTVAWVDSRSIRASGMNGVQMKMAKLLLAWYSFNRICSTYLVENLFSFNRDSVETIFSFNKMMDSFNETV
jgi:hypothetical protein